MDKRSPINVFLLSILVALTAQSHAASEADVEEVVVEQVEAAEIEDEALAVLRGMSDVLAAASAFNYQIETSFDVVQQSGTKVEFGASRAIEIARPNLMHMEVLRRDGTGSVSVFDGEHLWVYVPEHKVYAKEKQHGDLVEAVEYAVSELDIGAPLRSLVASSFYDTVVQSGLVRALLLDESVVAGTPCEHLLLSNDYTDFQLWITKDDKPLLKRIVITYREARGEPQFRAQFMKWDLAPTAEPGQFRFNPPADANQVRFHAPAQATNVDQESES